MNANTALYLRKIACILAFAGGIVAFFASLSYFFEGNFMPHFDYNKINSQSSETLTVIGIFIFIIAITTLVLSLFGFKKRYPRLLFISLIILGGLLLALLPFVSIIFSAFASFIAGILILSGGIIGDIGQQ